MNHDINIKKLRINCFRQSKVPGEFMLQLRVPGSLIDAEHLSLVQKLCQEYGNGTFHVGMRQTLNIPGIKYENVPKVNAIIKDYIKETEIDECDVNMEVNNDGYPTIGARNVMACIGNSHCIKANVNTHELAKKLEKEVFPSHYHIKMSISGCPNDCGKAHFQDFGIVGMARIDYHPERCIGCGACVEACNHHATRVLSLNKQHKIDKDLCCCVGCGECVLACPTSAWTRQPTKFYKILIGGRTGKQTPRMGKTFVQWVTEDVVIQIIKNWQDFSKWVMNNKPQYLHGGHLIDRAGYMKFKELMLKDVKLNPEAIVAENIFWAETEYRSQFNVRPLYQHHVAGPQPGNDNH